MSQENTKPTPAAKKVAAKKATVAKKTVVPAGWTDKGIQTFPGAPSLLSEVLPLKTDSYKVGHWKMLPGGTTNMYSYGESRGLTSGITDVVFYGFQAILKKHFSKQITASDVERTKRFADRHLRPGAFDYEGWMDVVTKNDGRLPIRISAIPEGNVVDPSIVLWAIEATDDKYAKLVSYFEPLFMQVWYPTTVASLSYSIKRMLKGFWEQTVDEENMVGLEFALHDFGFRGATCVEAAGAGGSGHLLNFSGTDTMQAICHLYDFYGLDEEDDASMPAYSVYATEHTIMSAHSDAENRDDLKAQEFFIDFLEKEGGIGSAVIDTYDAIRFAERLKSIFGDRVKALPNGTRFVLRPDSGDATVMPVLIIKMLMNSFGCEINKKGFKVLPPFLRVLQGDGMNINSIRTLCLNLRAGMISLENIVFGMGGGLLQSVTRDTLKFAQKASSITKDGKEIDVFKAPITDIGKLSKKGRVTTVIRAGKIISIRKTEIQEGDEEILRPVWEDGSLLVDENWHTIKARVTKAFAAIV